MSTSVSDDMSDSLRAAFKALQSALIEFLNICMRIREVRLITDTKPEAVKSDRCAREIWEALTLFRVRITRGISCLSCSTSLRPAQLCLPRWTCRGYKDKEHISLGAFRNLSIFANGSSLRKGSRRQTPPQFCIVLLRNTLSNTKGKPFNALPPHSPPASLHLSGTIRCACTTSHIATFFLFLLGIVSTSSMSTRADAASSFTRVIFLDGSSREALQLDLARVFDGIDADSAIGKYRSVQGPWLLVIDRIYNDQVDITGYIPVSFDAKVLLVGRSSSITSLASSERSIIISAEFSEQTIFGRLEQWLNVDRVARRVATLVGDTKTGKTLLVRKYVTENQEW